MVFISSPKTAPFILAFVGVALLAVVFIFGTYRQERVQIWLHPENYDTGYQTLQGLYAIGSGGLLARGWARVSRNWALSRRRRMI